MKSQTLESCPSCGSSQSIIDTLNNIRGEAKAYRIQCRNCHLTTKWCDTAGEARELWNTRVTEKARKEAAGGNRKGKKPYEGLLHTPATDVNFKGGIERMRVSSLRGMLERLRELEELEHCHKGRIKAVEKELTRREK
jgi:C4-type Zn-finger protein